MIPICRASFPLSFGWDDFFKTVYCRDAFFKIVYCCRATSRVSISKQEFQNTTFRFKMASRYGSHIVAARGVHFWRDPSPRISTINFKRTPTSDLTWQTARKTRFLGRVARGQTTRLGIRVVRPTSPHRHFRYASGTLSHVFSRSRGDHAGITRKGSHPHYWDGPGGQGQVVEIYLH